MIYMVSQIDRRRHVADRRRVQAGHQHRPGAGAGAEPRRDRGAAAAGRGAAHRRDGQEEVARSDDGGPSDLAGRDARPAVHLQLRDHQHQGCPHPRRRRRRHHRVRRPRLFDAGLARPRQGAVARPDRERRGRGAARRQRAGRGRRDQSAAGDVAGRLPGRGADARPAVDPGAVQRHHRRHRRRTAGSRGCATSRASSLAPTPTPSNAYLDGKVATAIGIFQRPGSNALDDRRRACSGRWTSSPRASRRASPTASPTTPPSSSSNRSTR